MRVVREYKNQDIFHCTVKINHSWRIIQLMKMLLCNPLCASVKNTKVCTAQFLPYGVYNMVYVWKLVHKIMQIEDSDNNRRAKKMI